MHTYTCNFYESRASYTSCFVGRQVQTESPSGLHCVGLGVRRSMRAENGVELSNRTYSFAIIRLYLTCLEGVPDGCTLVSSFQPDALIELSC